MIVATLRVLAPQVVPPGEVIQCDDLVPTRLDVMPATEEVDWAATAGLDALLHAECQGYRDAAFTDRLFRYHLGLTLRHWPRRVRTVALSLIVPPAAQRIDTIRRGDVTVEVTPIDLPRCSAESLLRDPTTACFAAGAHLGAWSVATLCARVASALADTRASFVQRHMAVLAAMTQGRYGAMVTAMEQANVEPVILEDFVRYGEDCGELRGTVKAVLRVCARRGLVLTAEEAERVHACNELVVLEEWLDRAATAKTTGEVFADTVSAST